MRRIHLGHTTAALAIVLALTAGLLAGCGNESGRITSPALPSVTTPDQTTSAVVGGDTDGAILPEGGASTDGVPSDSQTMMPGGPGAAGADLGSSPLGVLPDPLRSVDYPYSYRILNIIIWTYYHRLDFTYNGRTVTSIQNDTDRADVRNSLWTFTRYGHTEYYGPGRLYYYSEKTGLFERHLLTRTGPVIQRIRCTIWIRGWGNGTYNAGTVLS
jgi:hypothetical protein